MTHQRDGLVHQLRSGLSPNHFRNVPSSWSYYHNMTTTPKQDNTKKADDIIDVETTEVGPPTRLPPLKAPTIEPLGEWKQVRNYLINNLAHSHVYETPQDPPKKSDNKVITGWGKKS